MPKNGLNAEWSSSEESAPLLVPNAKMGSTADTVPTPTQRINTGSPEANVTFIQSDTQSDLRTDSHMDSQPVAYVHAQQRDSIELDNTTTAPDTTETYPQQERYQAERHHSSLSFDDKPDDVVIGQLLERSYSVIPGESVSFELALLNNGPEIAVFSPQIEGPIPQNWLAVTPSHTRLHPGERTSLEVTIRVPWVTMLRPDTYPLAIVVRAGGAEGRFCRISCYLQIKPFASLKLHELEPRKIAVDWRNPAKTLFLPVTNHGNEIVDVRLDGYDSANMYNVQFEILAPQLANVPEIARSRSHMLLPQYGKANSDVVHFSLHPGQTHYAPVTIRFRSPRLFSLKRPTSSLSVVAYSRQSEFVPPSRPIQSDDIRQSSNTPNNFGPIACAEDQWSLQGQVYGKAIYKPLIGLRTTLALSGLSILAILGLTLTLLLVTLTLQSRPQSAQPTEMLSVAPAGTQSQAPLEIVIKINELVPENGQGPALGNNASDNDSTLKISEIALAASAEALPTAVVVRPRTVSVKGEEAAEADISVDEPPQNNGAQTANADIIADSSALSVNRTPPTVDGVPVVQPSMVTAPREIAATNPIVDTSSENVEVRNPSRTSSNQEATNTEPSTSDMTYEQMFRSIGLGYDIDWRMLAAQAYVESSFNPMAQGKRGDLGLMQILPNTWQEWAPRANVQDPFDSYSNVLVAATYIDHLRTILEARGYPDDKWVLTAYNWGPNRVIDFLDGGGTWEALSQQRKRYATDVIRIANSLSEN